MGRERDYTNINWSEFLPDLKGTENSLLDDFKSIIDEDDSVELEWEPIGDSRKSTGGLHQKVSEYNHKGDEWANYEEVQRELEAQSEKIRQKVREADSGLTIVEKRNKERSSQASEVMLGPGESVEDFIGNRKRKRSSQHISKQIQLAKEYILDKDKSSLLGKPEDTGRLRVKGINRIGDLNISETEENSENKLSKFIQANRKVRSKDKMLLKSLNLTESQMDKVFGKDNHLTEEEKKRLDYLNRSYKKKRNRIKKIDIRDESIMKYMGLVGMASHKNIVLATWITPTSVRKRLNKLHQMKYVDMIVDSTNIVYWLTNAGVDYVNELVGDDRYAKYKDMKSKGSSFFGERAYVNHFIGMLYGGRYNLLRESNFKEGEEGVVSACIVPERMLWSEAQTAINKVVMDMNGVDNLTDSMKAISTFGIRKNEILKDLWDAKWNEWKMYKGESPEFKDRYLYIGMSDTRMTSASKSVYPDFIVERPRFPDGKPGSIAVEIERKSRDVNEYRDKLLIYKSNSHIYKQIVYVVSEVSTFNKLTEAAASVELPAGYLNIVPVVDYEGNAGPKRLKTRSL